MSASDVCLIYSHASHYSNSSLIKQYGLLATCINYAKLNNSVLCMSGHVFAGFFCCDVLFLRGKHNVFHHFVASV